MGKRKRSGFTLVEVVVVAVIVAVLAGVAIPLYSGYVIDSRMSLANSTAATVVTLLANERTRGATSVPGFATTIPAGTVVGSAGSSVTIPAKITITTTGTIAGGGTVSAKHDGVATSGDLFTF